MPTGTTVAVVGDRAQDALSTLEGMPGVEALSLHGGDPGLAARRITAAASPWIVHDSDPLVHVAAAWVELFEERSTLGALDAEVEAALAQFDEGSAFMPDYYIVLEPQEAPDTWRHWWCGALGRHAPQRIIATRAPATAQDRGIRRLLSALPSSRPWPDPASWLPDLPFAIPDRVGLRD